MAEKTAAEDSAYEVGTVAQQGDPVAQWRAAKTAVTPH